MLRESPALTCVQFKVELKCARPGYIKCFTCATWLPEPEYSRKAIAAVRWSEKTGTKHDTIVHIVYGEFAEANRNGGAKGFQSEQFRAEADVIGVRDVVCEPHVVVQTSQIVAVRKPVKRKR